MPLFAGGRKNAGWLKTKVEKKCLNLGGGFKYFLFSPLSGEDSHFD